VVDPFAMVEQYGLDKTRYFLMREIPFGQDGSYGHEAFVNRTNADLANDIGNLAQRSLSMIAKNCDGMVPQPGAFTAGDKAMLLMADEALVSARSAMAEQSIHTAIAATFAVVAEANRYFAGQEPWALKKTDPARMATVLYVTAEIIRRVAIQCLAVMPQSAAKLLDLVAAPQDQRDFAFAGEKGALIPGAPLPAPEPVFPRYVDAAEGGA
jgi:methionyl-tRNA synthetase